MRIALKYKKSAGVPVTWAVHSLIARGNAARDRQDWAEACDAYQRALKIDPKLAHIWIQLGNVSKEHGQSTTANNAYLCAAELQPKNAEPLVQLGHLYNKLDKPAEAGRYYLQAFKVNPNNADATAGLHRAIARATGHIRGQMIELLKEALADEHAENLFYQAAAQVSQLGKKGPIYYDDGVSLVFDASDLISYYSHARLPTGIQRVQIETINSALGNQSHAVCICCFIEGRDDWLEVPAGLFHSLTELSVKSGDRNDSAWITALNRLHLTLALAEPLIFPHGAYLINLGTSWWLQNYFLYVRHAKARYGIRYIPFVYDLIPIIMPEHFVKDLTQDFISWALGVFAYADYFLVISEATRRDLLRVADLLGHAVDPKNIAVIRLDADFRKPGMESLPRQALAKWQLDGSPFVLLVSTVESRKGHAVAMDAWLELLHRHGADRVPQLVCVGNKGWLNGEVYRRLEQNDTLAKCVVMLSGLSDEELALLYRHCLFTIYPSLYEGWGLPITESFCYGKPVITSNTSSLPEAGGEFAVYVEPGSPLQLAEAVDRMCFDATYRETLAARIREGFRPRTWKDVAMQIDAELMRLAACGTGPVKQPTAPMAKLGAYYPVTRNRTLRIWPGAGSGESFRTGLGWHWPKENGCWTRQQGGELAIGLPAQHGPLRIGLLLLGAPNRGMEWRLQIKHGPSLAGRLCKAGRKWVTFDYPALDDGDVLHLRLRGTWVEIDEDNPHDDGVSVGLAGFFIHGEGDIAARIRLLEAIALGNLDDVDAYRETLPAQGSDVAAWDEPDISCATGSPNSQT